MTREDEAQAAYDRWERLAVEVPPHDHGRVAAHWEAYLAASRDLRQRGWRPRQEGAGYCRSRLSKL